MPGYTLAVSGQFTECTITATLSQSLGTGYVHIALTADPTGVFENQALYLTDYQRVAKVVLSNLDPGTVTISSTNDRGLVDPPPIKYVAELAPTSIWNVTPPSSYYPSGLHGNGNPLQPQAAARPEVQSTPTYTGPVTVPKGYNFWEPVITAQAAPATTAPVVPTPLTSGTILPILEGGTGANNPVSARYNLGVIGISDFDAIGLHKYGNESISGIKTYTDGVNIEGQNPLKSSLTIMGAAGQVADIVSLIDYNSNNILTIGPNSSTIGGQLVVNASGLATTSTGAQTTTITPLKIIGSSEVPIDNITEWCNLSGVIVASINGAGTFSGNGSNLTNLNASSLTTGQVPGHVLGSNYSFVNPRAVYLRGDGIWAGLAGSPASAPSSSTYVLQTSDGALQNAQVLANLVTGVLKVNTGTGILETATPGVDYLAPLSTAQPYLTVSQGGLGTGAITGIVKGTGTSYVPATANTDYLTPTSNLDATNINAGTLIPAHGGLGTSAITGLIKGFAGTYTGAVAGTDYLAPGQAGDGSELFNLNVTNVSTGVLTVAHGGLGTGAITGLVKGTGSTYTAAIPGVDYITAVGGASLLNIDADHITLGILGVAEGGLGTGAITGLVRGTGSAYVAATPGIDYLAPEASGYRAPVEGRLTLTSGAAIGADPGVTSAGPIYFTPYGGNSIGLYDGVNWGILNFGETSVDISSYLATTTPVDIFVYNNSGTVVLVASAWDSTIARTSNGQLVQQDGVYVMSSDHTRRYLGTFQVTSGYVADTPAVRGLWNYYNRVPKTVRANMPLGGGGYTIWTYNTNTYRYANNTIVQVMVCVGVQESVIDLSLTTYFFLQNYANAIIGIGLDGVNNIAQNAQQFSAPYLIGGSTASINHQTTMGTHTYSWLELVIPGSPSMPITFQAAGNGGNYASGLTGKFWC